MTLRTSFIDFVTGLLNMDPIKRWSPQQAKQHPFITGEKFEGHWEVRTGTRARRGEMSGLKISRSSPLLADPVQKVKTYNRKNMGDWYLHPELVERIPMRLLITSEFIFITDCNFSFLNAL